MNERSLTVLHVITGLGDGGAEAVLYRLCVADHRHRHVVLSLQDDGKYGPLLRAVGVSVYVLQARPGQIPLRSFAKLWRRIRDIRPDVVQTWMYHADFLGGLGARLAGVRSVVWGIRNSDLDAERSSRTTIWLTRVLGVLSRFIPTRIAVCANNARDVHVALGYDASRMTVIANGYDVSEFKPDESAGIGLRKALGVDVSMPLIGSVGRYNPQKDFSNLLTALVRLRDQGHVFSCWLVGTGLDDTNDELVALIESFGLQPWVRLLGRRSDIPAVMNAVDVHVLPSAYGEAFPNVLGEAMACGTPCITTDVGDAAYIVDDTGWVVPRRDADALADALSTALREIRSTSWPLRCESCRKRIETHFSLERMTDAYNELWHEAVGGVEGVGTR